MVYTVEPYGFEPVHTLSPGEDFLIGVDEREWDPVDMSLCHLARVLERQRARGEVTRIGIFLITLEIESLKILIRDDGLTAHHYMSPRLDGLGDAVNGFGQMRDVSPDMPVSTGDDLGEMPVVVGHDERQPVELP